MKINFLVNYSWEWDLGLKPGPRTSGEPAISRPASIGPRLKTADASRIDLIIRWDGRRRLSDSLPMQSVYSDTYVVDDYRPDFRRQHVEDAIKWYSAQDVTLDGRWEPPGYPFSRPFSRCPELLQYIIIRNGPETKLVSA